MKKSIKVLSAIVAIILLSMTITVPVTAAEYDIEPRAVYFIGRENTVVYSESDPDEELLYCSASLTYNSGNKIAYMSASCSLGAYIYDFREFGVDLDGYVNCSSGYNDRTPRGEIRGLDVHDIAELHFEPDVSADCISIGSGNAFFIDTFSQPVVYWVFFGEAGVDFDY